MRHYYILRNKHTLEQVGKICTTITGAKNHRRWKFARPDIEVVEVALAPLRVLPEEQPNQPANP